MVDQVEIVAIGGRGGDGVVSFHTEKYKPKGPPDGGDGGDGGDVYIVGAQNMLTLYDITTRRRCQAENGQNGGRRTRQGKNGEDLVIKVPLGTQISLIEGGKKRLIEDTLNPDQRLLVARGGAGGRGNRRFKNSKNRSPKYAEEGHPGEAVKLILDLKIIADVGLIGLPNAGKSTLLNAITNAKSRVGGYPFTTLEPHLGVLDYQKSEVGGQTSEDRGQKQKTGEHDLVPRPRIVVADIPGLIDGASGGKGLGDKFLRHVERTTLLLHLVDLSQDRNLVDAYLCIRGELKDYSETLSEKEEIVIFAKKDLSEDSKTDNLREATDFLNEKGIKYMSVSAATGENLAELVDMLREEVALQRKLLLEEAREFAKEDKPVFRIGDLKNKRMVFQVNKVRAE